MLGRILGSLARRLRPKEPIDHAEQATRWVEQGIARNAAGDLADAAICFERALALDPGSIPALHGRAAMHHLAGENEDCVALCDEVLARAPEHINAIITRAFALRGRGDLAAALTAFRRAVEIEPRSGLISCVGGVLFQQGRIDEALAEIDAALAIEPEADVIHSNRLFILNHDPGLSAGDIAAAHFTWGREVAERIGARRLTHGRSGEAGRRLKVGYVSADLRLHSVSFYLVPVLEHHDRTQVEVFCYDNQTGAGDSFTRRLEGFADHWVRIASMDDEAFCARVLADGIDILVDLSGHTGGNRLPAFAMRPAPVQASWFGYMNTTGLSAMDYRITDAVLCPSGCELLYSETLFRIPCTAVWSPAPESPDVGPLPALSNGHVRFGSFNNWAKVSDAAVALWSRLLMQCPQARLVVVAAGADAEAARAGVADRFARHGVDRARLDITGVRPLPGFLELLASVDIALDPYPYNGGTTTMHTFWMGVPVVSMSTDDEIGRVSHGLLVLAGMPELCATSETGYLEAATNLAGDLPRLAKLRAGLRDRLRASPLMNGGEMAANLEKAYRAMWHNHLEGNKSRVSI